MSDADVIIIGAGFTGLAAGWDLARAGHRVVVVEAADEVGGLAAGFRIGAAEVERFYHHWFTSDTHITDLVAELGLADQVVARPGRTGMYIANRIFGLASPLDLLRFAPLPFLDRLRLGWMALRVRRVADWRPLEGLTAREWLIGLGGQRIYDVVWGPLLRGKFGRHADQVSAVWMWNKLKLRGSSRGRSGREELLYIRGGFASLARHLAAGITAHGGRVLTARPVTGLLAAGDRCTGVRTPAGDLAAPAVLATCPLPLVADLVAPAAPAAAAAMRRIHHLGAACLVLELDRSLSDTYWLNVNDPGFPFVAVIEHTNFEPPATYGGRHLVYLSRYLDADDPEFALDPATALDRALPHLQRMFPAFQRAWVLAVHRWMATHAQPLVERGYGALIPPPTGPLAGLHVATMAQIYPEDRGTNYAVRSGRLAAQRIAADLRGRPA
jgi:protoporphyrinogen oxidase